MKEGLAKATVLCLGRMSWRESTIADEVEKLADIPISSCDNASPKRCHSVPLDLRPLQPLISCKRLADPHYSRYPPVWNCSRLVPGSVPSTVPSSFVSGYNRFMAACPVSGFPSPVPTKAERR